MSNTFKLKTDPVVFHDVLKGLKTFEIRLDDRGYEVDDYLVLQETKYTGEEMKSGASLIYTGKEIVVLVTYIIAGPIYGLKDGWVIMSVIPAKEAGK